MTSRAPLGEQDTRPTSVLSGQAPVEIPWRVGSSLRHVRTEKGISLQKLAAATAEIDPEGKGILKAQIDRIENGFVTPDFREVYLLCEAMHVPIDTVVKAGPKRYPWFVVRSANAYKRLKEVVEGLHPFSRKRGQHKFLIDAGVYKYLPLDRNDDYTEPEDRFGTMRPLMRKYLFSVGHATDEQMLRGLFDHEGEEIVFVIQGPVELWFQQPDSDEIRKLILEPGDSAQYLSGVLHSYRALNPNERSLALFVYVHPSHLKEADMEKLETPQIISVRLHGE